MPALCRRPWCRKSNRPWLRRDDGPGTPPRRRRGGERPAVPCGPVHKGFAHATDPLRPCRPGRTAGHPRFRHPRRRPRRYPAARAAGARRRQPAGIDERRRRRLGAIGPCPAGAVVRRLVRAGAAGRRWGRRRPVRLRRRGVDGLARPSPPARAGQPRRPGRQPAGGDRARRHGRTTDRPHARRPARGRAGGDGRSGLGARRPLRPRRADPHGGVGTGRAARRRRRQRARGAGHGGKRRGPVRHRLSHRRARLSPCPHRRAVPGRQPSADPLSRRPSRDLTRGGEAEGFRRFLLSPAGQAVFRRFGFTPARQVDRGR